MKLDLKKWPFGTVVALSIVLSVLHALVQLRWAALRYRSFGPRPLGAPAIIAVEVLLLMVIFTVGMMHVSDEESTKPSGGYYLGMAAAIGARIVVSFVI